MRDQSIETKKRKRIVGGRRTAARQPGYPQDSERRMVEEGGRGMGTVHGSICQQFGSQFPDKTSRQAGQLLKRCDT